MHIGLLNQPTIDMQTKFLSWLTAALIGIDIHINSRTCTVARPVNIISKLSLCDYTNTDTITNQPYLLIGYDSEHFQSLIPRSISETGTINNVVFSYAEAVKASKTNDANLHIKFPPMKKIRTQRINNTLGSDTQVIQIQEVVEKKKEVKWIRYQQDEDKREEKYQQKKDKMKMYYQQNKENRKEK